jgi:hypothetical protein
MNKRPGHVEVTTEVGYCSFCDRTRNLRREEHHLGTLVRTIVTCESCHRTLSSTMGVATAEMPEVETPASQEETIAPAAAEASPTPKPPAKPAAATRARPAAAKSKSSKPRTTKRK